MIAYGMVNGKLNDRETREAVDCFLEFIKKHPNANLLDVVILNGFGKIVPPDYVHDIGKMTSDIRYIGLWPALMDVLEKIKTPEAIAYLKASVQGPFTAACALSSLARLRVEGTLALCEEALGRKDVQYKDAIRETYTKLKRQLAKKQSSPKHITTDELPKGLAEWSANLDAPQLPKVLRCIQKLCEFGFAKDEIAEIQSVTDDLSPEQTVRFKFDVGFVGKKTTLWIEIFCDDEDAPDLYIFSDTDLMEQIEKSLNKVIQ